VIQSFRYDSFFTFSYLKIKEFETMSWSVNLIGTPEKVVEELKARSEKESGQCKVEYDAALPALVCAVEQNFNKQENASPVLVKLDASGSGWAKDGAQVQRSCRILCEQISGKLLV
jgi:hypothetical protein